MILMMVEWESVALRGGGGGGTAGVHGAVLVPLPRPVKGVPVVAMVPVRVCLPPRQPVRRKIRHAEAHPCADPAPACSRDILSLEDLDTHSPFTEFFRDALWRHQ